MALEKYRKSASEMDLESRVNQLYTMFSMMATSLKTALPTVPGLGMFDSCNMGSIGYMPFPLDGVALLSGRGPRFVAQYNLAASDAERQGLLDSLPRLGEPAKPFGHGFSDYFQEYRLQKLDLEWGRNSAKMAEEWEQFYAQWGSDLRSFTFDGTLEEYFSKFTPYTLDPATVYKRKDDHYITVSNRVSMGTEPIMLKLRIAEKVEHVILLPMPEIKGFLVVTACQAYHSNSRMVISPDCRMTVRWADHENCWAFLNGISCPTDVYARTLETFAQWLGYPPYVEPDYDRMFELFEQIVQRIIGTWDPIIPEDFTGEMKIRLRDVLELEIRRPHSLSYSHIHYKIRPLDQPDDLVEYAGFRVAKDRRNWEGVTAMYSDVGKFKRELNIPHRQRERITHLLAEFLASESLEIDFVSRED